MRITVHLPNGLPAEAYLDDLQREFPDVEAFVGLSTDGDALDAVHAAYPNADILVRFYAANRMGLSATARANEDVTWLERHPWVRHVTPANELNLDGEHAGLNAGFWQSAEGYYSINRWLMVWRRDMLPFAEERGLILHWPALSPQPDELAHLNLCDGSLRVYDVKDIHWYGESGLFRRLAAYQDVVMRPPQDRRFAPRKEWPRFWVTETNQGQHGNMREFMRNFRENLDGRRRGDLELFAFFIYDSADPAFDWCTIRGKPEALLWMTIAREAKEWPTTPTPQPPPPGGNDMVAEYRYLKDQYPDVYTGWLAEQSGGESILAWLFEDHGVGIGLRAPTQWDLERLTQRLSGVTNQLAQAVRRLPKAP